MNENSRIATNLLKNFQIKMLKKGASNILDSQYLN